MLTLSEVSSIGFGGYRIQSQEHAEALEESLRSGCNLVDTAASYTGGRSEALVGSLTSTWDRDVFIITKAGYGDAPNSPHDISPSAIRDRLRRSLERLNRSWVDAFLLHNPERLLLQGGADETLANDLRAAFDCLEELVSKGCLRFYGVSSNVLCAPPVDAVSLEGLVELARDVCADNHFRILQFPCNLIERSPLLSSLSSPSLLERARSENLITIANRPLNAMVHGSLVRLVTDEAGDAVDEAPLGRTVLMNLVSEMQSQLRASVCHQDADDYEVVRYLLDHYPDVGNSDAVEAVFDDILRATIVAVFGVPTPSHIAKLVEMLRAGALTYARRRAHECGSTLRTELQRRGVIPKSDIRPLQVTACQALLDAGCDHVLVGMRRASYVRQLAPLFTYRPDTLWSQAGSTRLK
jgi:aryl-alcohol dehydrogenase-like predicted oxidoreductase